MATQKQYKYTLPIGYKLKGGENDYVIEEVLGKGGFGVTYKVKATIMVKKIPFDLHFAVKEYFPDICSREADNATIKIPETKHDEIANGIKDFINEGKKLQAMCDLNPNIVNVNEVFQANDTAYYVLEYLEGGDLRKMVKNNGGALTEQQMLDVMVPIGNAVQCLHDNNILHLDIKPDNIVMRRNSKGEAEPVLIDFGIAVHFRSDGTPTSKTPSQGISPGYSPVEQYSPLKKFDPRIDVYAFGATCLYLLTGKDPKEVFDLNAAILSNEIPNDVSPRIAHAIIHAMSKDKFERTGSIVEMLKELATKKNIILVEPEKPLSKPIKDTVNLDARKASVKSSPVTKPVENPIPVAEVKSDGDALPSPHNPNKSIDRNDSLSQKSLVKKAIIGIAILLAIALVVGLLVLGKRCTSSSGNKVDNKEQSVSEPKVTDSAELANQEHDIKYMKKKDVWVIDSLKSEKYRNFAMAINDGDFNEFLKGVEELRNIENHVINGYLIKIAEMAKLNPGIAADVFPDPNGSIDLIRISNELSRKINSSEPQNDEETTVSVVPENKHDSKRLQEIDNEIAKINLIKSQLSSSDFKVLPSNLGINDVTISAKIKDYNEKILQRNSLVENSGSNNPIVQDLDQQLYSDRASLISSLNKKLASLKKEKDALSKK